MFNSIVMTIFGVSLLENFGFEFISNFLRETRNILRNIVDYLTDTKFYQSLENLYGKKESTLEKHSNEFETINKFNNKEDVIRRISENAERKELEKIDSTRKHYNTSKISDWLNGDKDSIPEVNTQAEADVENNRINYRKYLIIVGLLTGSVLAYIYFDDIKTNSISLWEWFNSFRSGGTGNDGNEGNEGNNTGGNTNKSSS